MMPITLIALEAARDSEAALQWLNHAQGAGIPAPFGRSSIVAC